MCGGRCGGWKNRPQYFLAQEHWCLECPYREKIWVTASMTLQSPRWLLELEQPQTQPGSLALWGCQETPLCGTWGRSLQDCLPDREPRAEEKQQGQGSIVHEIHKNYFSPPSLPQANNLPFPMLKQAQLVGPHGPAPETSAGGKGLIRTGRTELCCFLFPPFSLLMAKVGGTLCLRAVVFIYWKKP